MDGASLFQADPIAHVLRQDEEVRAVVKQWACPPLAERYSIACKVAGVGEYLVALWFYGSLRVFDVSECNSKALDLFERNNEASSLDLSYFDLQPRDSTPLFQALHSQHHLTVLNLSGNRLRNDAMSQLLLAWQQLQTLTSLDLSSTGITHQVNSGFEVL